MGGVSVCQNYQRLNDAYGPICRLCAIEFFDLMVDRSWANAPVMLFQGLRAISRTSPSSLAQYARSTDGACWGVCLRGTSSRRRE